MTRKHIIFSGRVQGVGFRYRAQYAANLYRVTGWIRNCYNGDVEMEAEGRKEDIERMIATIDEGTFIRIDGIKERTIELQGSRSFEIKDY